MVATTDLKAYKSTGGLGGPIDLASQIITNTKNNFFGNSTGAECAAGEDYYGAFFMKNAHASEDMNEPRFWLDSGSKEHDSNYKFGFDPICFPQPTIKLDGVDDYVDCADDAELWSRSLTKFSFEIWIFPTKDGLGGGNLNIVQHGTTTAQTFRLTLPNATNQIRWQINDAAAVAHNATATIATLVNNPHRVLCTYDNSLGSNNLAMYVDGALVANANLTEAINSANPLRIADSTADFQGYVKLFRFWRKIALTAQNAIDLNNGDEEKVPPPDYFLKMDEGTGNPVDTASGTKIGTLTGGAAWQTNPQTIADTFTAPVGITWSGATTRPDDPSLPVLKFGNTFSVWTWKHLDAGCKSRINDPELFAFTIKIPSTGTGTPGDDDGGGSGGNPEPVADYKVAFAGDWGCEQVTDDVIDLINEQNYDFVFGVGDNSYSKSTSCWTDRFKSLMDAGKFDSGYGNHEYEDSGISPYNTFLQHSGSHPTYFTRKFKNILFICCDTNINCDPGSGQHNFISDELKKTANDSSIVWKIAIMHHPWFGASSQHSYDNNQAVEAFHSLFIQYGVQFVICGHNHNFQRTHLVGYNSDTPTSPKVVSSSPPFNRSQKGLVHVVSGGGGHDSPDGSGADGKLYSLGSQPGFQAYQSRTHNGVWEIAATNGGNTLTCQFREVGGDVFDTFVFNA